MRKAIAGENLENEFAYEQDAQEKKYAKDVERAYKIGYIREGIVIDHLPPKTALKIVDVLGLSRTSTGLLSLGINLDTKKHASGKKDLIKIERKTLSENELNKIALIAPDAVVNIIKNSRIIRKFKVELPDVIENVIKCGNPNCITHAADVSKFTKDKEKLKCHYCEKSFELKELELL